MTFSFHLNYFGNDIFLCGSNSSNLFQWNILECIFLSHHSWIKMKLYNSEIIFPCIISLINPATHFVIFSKTSNFLYIFCYNNIQQLGRPLHFYFLFSQVIFFSFVIITINKNCILFFDILVASIIVIFKILSKELQMLTFQDNGRVLLSCSLWRWMLPCD